MVVPLNKWYENNKPLVRIAMDEDALFLLSFLEDIGPIPINVLTSHIDAAEEAIRKCCERLEDARLILRGEDNTTFKITENGHSFLEKLKLSVMAEDVWFGNRLKKSIRAWVEHGRVFAAGLESCMAQPQIAFARTLGLEAGFGAVKLEKETGFIEWNIPLPASGAILTVRVRPSDREDEWKVDCLLTSRNDPDEISHKARIEIRKSGQLVLAGRFSDFIGSPILLRTGEYDITIAIAQDVRVIPVSLGK